jgi:hypothetical protein
MKNRGFGLPSGIGKQPIRVLQPLLAQQFENSSPEFRRIIADSIDFCGTSAIITYDVTQAPVDVPEIRGAEGSIRIQETFLSYLWAVTYATVVITNEDIMRPQIEPNYSRTPAQEMLIDDAYSLLSFALYLRKSFAIWDTEHLPNPEIFSQEEEVIVGQVSAVFCQAVVFILVHEFGHLYLGHLESGPPANKADSKADETMADLYAIAVMKEGVDTHYNRKTVYCGILAGLIAILFLHLTLDGDSHPDPHQRLYTALCELGLDPNDELWAFASAAIVLWAHNFRSVRLGGHDGTSLRDNFELLLAELADPLFFTTH